MTDTTIKIQNCNNILNGEITIYADKLNILFGCNGTGKSTIARAIELASQDKELSELMPYGITNTETSPIIEGLQYNIVAIFNDEYVKQYVFQPDSLIKNTFEVLIRSEDFDKDKKNIDDALSNIKTTITSRQEIIDLRSQIGALIDKIKLNNDKTIAKRGGVKSFCEGKGHIFNPPEELIELTPFFEKNIVSKWANWRLQGLDQFGNKGLCPYCSISDSQKTDKINKVLVENFDKSSIEIAVAIQSALDVLRPYLSIEKTDELFSLFGDDNNLAVLETQLAKLLIEAKYLHEKLTTIVSFNESSVGRDNIADLESRLLGMKVDFRSIDAYFVSELTNNEMKDINGKIDNLLGEIDELKGAIGRCNSYIQEKIKNRRQDINEFLKIAGYKYAFDVIINGENNAKALLKFILPNGEYNDLDSPKKYLSWGEKHAFALILFMFDAISQNADLIILDDPISSFDSNKKYAIINRLFQTGNKENSLYQRTVLLLTHDFEPVIDYIQSNSGKQDPTAVCATYFENINRQLKCVSIQKNSDLMSSMVMLKELAVDVRIDIAARIGCLRKFIEHQHKNPISESYAYNILSSLIHGRNEPTNDLEGINKLTKEEIDKGLIKIKYFIPDFDYVSFLEQCAPQNLIERYSKEQSAYIKMLILRMYIEQDEDARDRLRKMNDVLRKYVDETYHIENDYLYSLDVRRFNIVPDFYITEADRYVKSEKTRYGIE